MDDELKHEDDDLQDNDLDHEDTDIDDSNDTPADTDDESDDLKRESAEEVKQRQKLAWLRKIKNGEKTIEDMPNNLNWLKKDIEKELNPKKSEKKVEQDELESKIRATLQKERDQEDFQILAADIEDSDLDSETLATLKETYESLLEDKVPQLKALVLARRVAGLKDSQEVVRSRRRKAMTLPPQGSINRKVVKKDGMNDVERQFMNNLPPAYR